jgi:hypothetical protein
MALEAACVVLYLSLLACPSMMSIVSASFSSLYPPSCG